MYNCIVIDSLGTYSEDSICFKIIDKSTHQRVLLILKPQMVVYGIYKTNHGKLTKKKEIQIAVLIVLT